MAYGLLQGKKAIVTGARGLASGVVERFTQEGAEVIVFSRTDSGQKLVEEGKARRAIAVDLADREKMKEAFDEALAAFGGRLDILVNCAGIQRRHDPEAFPAEDWDDVIRVNLTTCFLLCQLAGNVMIRQGSGKIINFASMLSFFGGSRIPAYAASKGGVKQLTKALANDWAGKGVNINAIAPGYMNTDMISVLVKDPVQSRKILDRIPAGRWGTPEDVAGPCVFLASDLSDYLNGAVIPVDGGYLGA